MNNPIKYPVGEQSFEQLRKDGFLYMDKTPYIEKIISGSKYFFLGRPRRFGKSLFLSTLRCFFEGKRELFKGLYIDSIEWDWTSYPVLYLDLNTANYKEDGSLEDLLEHQLSEWETQFGIVPKLYDHVIRFKKVVQTAYEKTGKNVVILVDEYDKPLVKNLDDKERFERYREILASFYSNFKSSAEYIRLVFLTGVSRFGKLSVFSGLNNLADLSLDKAYAGVCGITESELIDNFGEGIKALANEEGKRKDEIISLLKRRYDGYHFAKVSPDIYNPFSLLNTFAKKDFGSYWIESGTPSLLVKQLKRTNVDLVNLYKARSSETKLSGLDLDNLDPVSLLYQTGYLTIKSYDARLRLFQLGYPNEEVVEGFYEYLLPYYTNLRNQDVMMTDWKSERL